METTVIDDYIAGCDSSRQPQLEKVCETIRKALPGSTECISWGMPTWRDRHNLIHMAAQKNHIGIYPGPDAIVHFASVFEELGLRYSKGAVQIPYDGKLPLRLIRSMALWCRKNQESE